MSAAARLVLRRPRGCWSRLRLRRLLNQTW